ncbi:arylformamidase [Advenella mimigardefordensis]|uniref:Kynurenine formamidase n=1 Tax=Advenella mimigardefordensis (strain DSM 17166 / LMG 22922 / DPN7) TaxID=1247726 RepID=W0PGM8_ADVMD|nr:arylformamidase [Advenella mimigardefordensis]AHG64415.1 kynurenine formamidase [Advenella mimigardefordensis DPN7]
MSKQQIWDISAPVDAQSPVFPGDTPYTQKWSWTLSADCPVNVSEISLSPHVGTHADAPLHYDSQGSAVGELSLTPFIGPCRVLHILRQDGLIYPDDMANTMAGCPPRLLVRSCQQARTREWSPAFASFAPETLDVLHQQGIILIGIDTPSIDPAASKSLDSHQRIRRYDMRVLENLVLDQVPAGDYELIALPLKWTRADASPVRAILRSL